MKIRLAFAAEGPAGYGRQLPKLLRQQICRGLLEPSESSRLSAYVRCNFGEQFHLVQAFSAGPQDKFIDPHVGLALDRLLQRGAITGLRLVRIGSFNQATAVASSANLFTGEIER